MGKYIKYAIGEIILVMAGILLALQVNNWNEGRKEAENQSKLFANLKIDFQNRLVELEEFKTGKEKAINHLVNLNRIITKKDTTFNKQELIKGLAYMRNNFAFNDNFKLLEGVFNTGLINNIKNETLKRKLIEWPQLVEEMLEEQRIYLNDNSTKYGPLLERYISSRRLWEKFDFRDYAIPKGLPIGLTENYEELLKDPLLENYLATKEVLIRISIIDNNNLIVAAKEIIKLLEENQ